MNEGLEGELVRVNGATFPLAGIEIAGNLTYDFTADGETGVIYVRSSNSLVGDTLTGCAQWTWWGLYRSSPLMDTGGYQLLAPRSEWTMIPASDICYTSPVVQSNMSTTGFTLELGYTDLASAGTVEYGLTEDLGQVIEGASGSTTDHSVDLTGLEAGHHLLRACEFSHAARGRTGTCLPSVPMPPSPSPLAGDIHVLLQWRGRRVRGHGRGGHVAGNGHERHRSRMDHLCAAHLGRRGVQLQRPNVGGRL